MVQQERKRVEDRYSISNAIATFIVIHPEFIGKDSNLRSYVDRPFPHRELGKLRRVGGGPPSIATPQQIKKIADAVNAQKLPAVHKIRVHGNES